MMELSSGGDDDDVADDDEADDDEADDDEADDDEADETDDKVDEGLDEATSSSVLAFKASSSL